MDDDGVCTTVPDPCLSLVTSVSLQFARACVVTESRGSYVKLNYMSIKADLATETVAADGKHRHQELVDDWKKERLE